MFTATVIASILLALVSAASGLPKIIGAARMVEEAKHLGLSRIAYMFIGTLEVAAAAGLLLGLAIAPLGIAAAGGLVLMMTGAVISHIRVQDRPAALLPAALIAVASAATLILRLATT